MSKTYLCIMYCVPYIYIFEFAGLPLVVRLFIVIILRVLGPFRSIVSLAGKSLCEPASVQAVIKPLHYKRCWRIVRVAPLINT